jgi:hypothetical protein
MVVLTRSFYAHIQACWKVNPQERPSIRQVIDDLCVVIKAECGDDEQFLSFVQQQREASIKEEETCVVREVTRKDWKKETTVTMPDSKMETTHRPKCMCVAGPFFLFLFLALCFVLAERMLTSFVCGRQTSLDRPQNRLRWCV